MIYVYVRLIKLGMRTLEDVPALIRDSVEAALN